MTNQGENTDTVTTLDRSSTEKHPIDDPPQTLTPSYHSSNYNAVSWGTQGENLCSKEKGLVSESSFNYTQQVEEPKLKNVHDEVIASFVPSTSNSGAPVAAQGYSGYNAFQNTDSYAYSNTGYADYYNGCQQQSHQYQMQPIQYQQQTNQFLQQSSQYQQQSGQYQQQSSQYQQQPGQYQQQSSQYQQHSNQSYPHHGVTYQNTGAPYEPLSSFQNSGSHTGPASYSSTYYNPGDYQTSGNYMSSTYAGSANLWHSQPYAPYNSHQYPNYAAESSSTYSSTSSATFNHYHQHYKQWGNYYSQSQTEVSCAPGTEKLSVSSASAISSILNTNTGYAASNNHTPSWQPASSSSEMTILQPVETSGNTSEVYRKHGISDFQKDQYNPMQPHQKPPDAVLIYESLPKEQNSAFSQGPTTLYTSYQASQSYHTIPSPVPLPLEDARRVIKMQIPNNPIIASNFAMGVPKSNKDIPTPATFAKPAYISVPMQKPDDKVTTHDATDSILKPGMFPKSLRGYVERALARCKDDKQKVTCQTLMKELITRATADGTLYTRDWDTEPIISLPNGDGVNKEVSEFAIPAAAVPVSKRSPARRAKSRWEPVPEDNLTENSSNLFNKTPKCGGWNKQFMGHKLENKEGDLGTKFSLSCPKVSSKNVMRPAKRRHVCGYLIAADDQDDFSNSDEDHSLTKYSAAAVALVDSPEEMTRRENRSKRFEKKRGNRVKNGESGNLYARKANALVLSRNVEESGSRAVEDIDWDALTVKGTCHEIEKRYLRLTSAPDPASVRPEEVLEKSLLMVQDSKKNYLYKCDQLKSVRQDLTVQRIRNELTVKVYETHARLSIEFGDLPEYNQCQSQLKLLYAEGIEGSHMEFAAYNLLCAILHSNNKREFILAVSRLSAEAKKDEAVKHALLVRAAVTSGNYVMFFRLYKTAPNISTFFMDLFVEKMRYAALKCISQSYRPTVPVSYLSQILGFSSALSISDASDAKEVDSIECTEWLKAHGACLQTENSGEVLLDAKASVSSLYMPEPDDAVAHGDSNLAVNDFFTRNLA